MLKRKSGFSLCLQLNLTNLSRPLLWPLWPHFLRKAQPPHNQPRSCNIPRPPTIFLRQMSAVRGNGKFCPTVVHIRAQRHPAMQHSGFLSSIHITSAENTSSPAWDANPRWMPLNPRPKLSRESVTLSLKSRAWAALFRRHRKFSQSVQLRPQSAFLRFHQCDGWSLRPRHFSILVARR